MPLERTPKSGIPEPGCRRSHGDELTCQPRDLEHHFSSPRASVGEGATGWAGPLFWLTHFQGGRGGLEPCPCLETWLPEQGC